MDIVDPSTTIKISNVLLFQRKIILMNILIDNKSDWLTEKEEED